MSVERKHDPTLAGKPVIVGGGESGNLRRGVVAACSYETRIFGVRSAMPLLRAVKLCPEAIVVPVGRSDYAAETARIRHVLESFTDHIEMTSPDEAYVDLQRTALLHGPPIRAADRLRQRISQGVGLPVSVGLATSKTVAKVASKISKPQGMFVVMPGSEASILRPFPIRVLPGLGPKTEAILIKHGIETLGQLQVASDSDLLRWLGDHGIGIQRRAKGLCDSEVQPSRERVQISTEETFSDDISDPERLHAELAAMTMQLGAKLRRRGLWAGTISVKIRYPDFITITRQRTLDPATHDDVVLLAVAEKLLGESRDPRRPLRLLGVGVSNLGTATQPDFCSVGAEAKRERILDTLDSLSQRVGKGKIGWGGVMTRRGSGARGNNRRG
ncbi:DNA polymerase IV [Candidatus Sumerlaeota bacterium]|nr:DNA polymerase IV [Candidatus Sumerlaeota bacterium]